MCLWGVTKKERMGKPFEEKDTKTIHYRAEYQLLDLEKVF